MLSSDYVGFNMVKAASHKMFYKLHSSTLVFLIYLAIYL